MKILFLNPPGPKNLYRGSVCTYLSKARYVWKPKDYLLLSSVLPSHWEIEFLDASINKKSSKFVFDFVHRVSADACILALSSITWRDDFQFLQRFCQQFPRMRTILFGEVFLEEHFRKLVHSFCHGIIFDPLRDDVVGMLTSQHDSPNSRLPGCAKSIICKDVLPARQWLFDNRRYRWPFVKHSRYAAIYTQYGCPFTCSYCTESITSVTYRSWQNVLKEIEAVAEQGYREIHFGDASFGYPRENIIRLLSSMVSSLVDFEWSAYTHPALVDKNMLDLMSQSGCHTLVFGIDSADSKLLETYGRKISHSLIRDFVQWCHDRNISLCGDIILGFPQDTLESCKRTVDFALDLDLDYLSVNIATPLMGTSVREAKRNEGIIVSDSTGFDTAGLNDVACSQTLSATELIELKNQAVARFYFRPNYLLKRLRKLTTIEEACSQTMEGLALLRSLLAIR